MKPTKVIRRRGLQCPFNSSQYMSIALHAITTTSYIIFAATGCLEGTLLLVSLVLFTILTTFIVVAWLFTSMVDASQPPSHCGERLLCGSLYCFKRAQLKTRYCAVSKKKVPQMDHFCVWMNTTIGSRNYPSFFMVALFSTVLMWFQMGLSIVALVNNSAKEIVVAALVSSLFQLLCALLVATPYTTLLMFHVHLILKQISTFDFLMLRAQKKAALRKALKIAEKKALAGKDGTAAASPVVPVPNTNTSSGSEEEKKTEIDIENGPNGTTAYLQKK